MAARGRNKQVAAIRHSPLSTISLIVVPFDAIKSALWRPTGTLRGELLQLFAPLMEQVGLFTQVAAATTLKLVEIGR